MKSNGKHAAIKSIIIYNQPLQLFDLSVKDSNNYFVSNASILTHNFFPILIELSIIFGEGSVVVEGITAGLAVLGGALGLKLAKDKHRHKVEPKIVIETPFCQSCYGGPPSPMPDPDDNKDKKRNIENNKPKTIDDIISESKPGRKTKGKTKQFEKCGDFNVAIKDFEAMKPKDIKDSGNLKIGILDDGRTVNVRTKSSAQKPTLEVYDPTTEKSIKIRYGN